MQFLLYSILTYSLIILILLSGCGKKEEIVATFGKHKITLEEFRIAYLEMIKQPNMFDSKEQRENFLNEMISRRLIAEEAKRSGMQHDEKLKYRIDAYHNKCLRDVHYQKIIKTKIRIQNEDIDKVYAYTQEQRHIKHLFAETQEQADTLYQLLERGEDFDELASIVFSDTSLADSGGDMGWVYWDQLEFDLAMAAFSQPIHIYSKPIKSRFGYHIIKVIDYKKNPILSEQDYLIHQEKTKYLLEYKIGEKIANQYVENLIAEANIKVYPRLLQFVGQSLAQIFERKPNPQNQMSIPQLKQKEIDQLELNLWDIRNEALATINGEILTVGEFIGSLNYIPYSATYRSYKTALDYAFRDFLLTKEAYQFGFDKSIDVKRKVRLFEENLAYLELRNKLVQEVTVSEDEIKTYFNQRVVSKNSKAKYEDFHDSIDDIIRSEKKRKVIPDFAKHLSKGITITKNIDIIHGYYDNISGNQTDQTMNKKR